MISKEGQQIFKAADYLPALLKVPANDSRLKPEGGGFEALVLNPDETEEKAAQVGGDRQRAVQVGLAGLNPLLPPATMAARIKA